MSDADKNKLPAQRVTLAGSRSALVVPCCLAILFAVIGIAELKHGIKSQAGLFCLLALGQLFNVPERWKDYRQVRQGIEVYTPAQVERPDDMPVPKAISVTVVLILSGFVGVVSIGIIALAAHIAFSTPVGCIAAIGILLFLWLLTAYFWHRILTEKPSAQPVLVQRQPEGVWPPAPAMTTEKDNQ